MTDDIDVLRAAISRVESEQSHLRKELRAFQSFREAVGSIPPEAADDTDHSEATDRVLETYHEHVVEVVDYETVYGEPLERILVEEFSQSIANTVLGEEIFTQRRKRNLLLAMTEAVELREWFLAQLDSERDALETYIDELSEMDAAIDELPECSPRMQSLERLLVVWNDFDALEERCERLLERRQRQLREADLSILKADERYAYNVYLYQELDTLYPVLSVLGATLERIEAKREGQQSTAAGRSLES